MSKPKPSQPPESDPPPDPASWSDPPGAGVPTDTRRARKRQERQLLLTAIAVLVVVGGGLIALIYGPAALITALPCLLSGAGAILILYLLFVLAERWVSR